MGEEAIVEATYTAYTRSSLLGQLRASTPFGQPKKQTSIQF